MDTTEITAGRLHLRPWLPRDVVSLAPLLADPGLARWTTLSDEGPAGLVTTSAGRWAQGTGADFAVLDATTAQVLGGVGLYGIADGDAGVGWWSAPQGRGGGVATDAVQVLCRWAFGALGLHRLAAQVEVGNWASRAVAEKAGFTVEGVQRDAPAPGGRRADTWLASLLATDEVRDRRAIPAYGRRSDGVVTLRPLAERDLPDVARACDDPETARWLPVPAPYGLEAARAWTTRLVPGEWADGKVASVAVADAADDALLGAVALTLRGGIGEVGYWTAPWARGRGVAARAARLHTDWGFEVLRLPRVELLTDVRNTASQRAAEKAGFVREGVARALRTEPRGQARVDMVVWADLPPA